MIINCDAILLNNYSNLLQDLQKKFNPDKMDALLAFSSPKNALGYSGSGDYIIANDGTVIESDRSDKMVFMGISVLNTKTLELVNAERFSLVEIWSKLIKKEHVTVWCLRKSGSMRVMWKQLSLLTSFLSEIKDE